MVARAAVTTTTAATISHCIGKRPLPLYDFRPIYGGGIKRHWIVYNIHAIKANDLDILAQQLAAEHEVEHTTMLRALLAMVSLRERGWQEPSASSLSGTHAGMPDFTRLVSFLGTKKGQTLDTGLIYDELPLGLLTKVLMLASPPCTRQSKTQSTRPSQ